MSKGIIYYTDNQLDESINREVQKQLLKAQLPITSASLKPIHFGDNEALEGERSYPMMVEEIISCLSRSTVDYVFFCEHDVLYPVSHFDFTPSQDNIFYYNQNVWRWLLGSETVIRHDRMLSLSQLCVNRKFALDHYISRMQRIIHQGWAEVKSHEPQWARVMGYEPGTKKKKRGGFSDDDYDTWESSEPLVDIRHKGTYSPPKVTLDSFTHPPKWWKEEKIDTLKEWDLRKMFL